MRNRTQRIIEHKLNYYIIEQDLFEPDELFYERVNYILKNIDDNDINILIKKSRIISNMQHYDCEYNNVKNIIQILNN